ncbi:MAG: glycosyltransferase, partial [Devosia sp.]
MSESALTIIVPTINSADFIGIVLDYYRANDISITVFVDGKTTDDTHAVASRYFPVRSISNPATRVGEVIEAMSRQTTSKWVLRIDDDELPSVEMMRFVMEVVQRDDADVYGFSRYECAVSQSGKLLHHPDHDADDHRQWRLYQPAVVNYTSQGHTPGFDRHGLRVVEAPRSACLIHLDWVLHSYQARKEKVERYDRHTPGHG